MVHPDDWQAVKHSIQTQLVQSQYKLDYVEYRIVRKDGEIRWIEDYGHFVHSETVGDIFYVFLSDATEKKHQLLTEKALLVDERRKNEQRLQNLIQEYNREKALMNQEQLRRLEVIEGLSVNYDSIFYVDLYKNKIFPYRLSERNSFLFEAKFQPRDYDWYSTQYLDAWCIRKTASGSSRRPTPFTFGKDWPPAKPIMSTIGYCLATRPSICSFGLSMCVRMSRPLKL